MRKIAFDLAKWLVSLHSKSRNVFIGVPSQKVTIGAGNNSPVPEFIYRYTYNNLHTALSRYGHDTQLAAQINEEFGSLLATDNECLCHGSFHPEKVLIRSTDPFFTEPNSEKRLPDLTIVDWRTARWGASATDVGQFAAAAFLIDRFRGARDLFRDFLNAYILARRLAAPDGIEPIRKAWIRRMAVHWAVHVAFWPTQVAWTHKQGTQILVDIGVRVLKAALADDWTSLRESALFRNLSSDWTTAFLLD
jgi:hypothetical protein